MKHLPNFSFIRGQDMYENLHLFMSPLINGLIQLQERNDILLNIQGMKCLWCFGQLFQKFGFLMILGMKIKNVKKIFTFIGNINNKNLQSQILFEKIKFYFKMFILLFCLKRLSLY